MAMLILRFKIGENGKLQNFHQGSGYVRSVEQLYPTELKLRSTKKAVNEMSNQMIESLSKTFSQAIEIVKKKNQDYASNSSPYRNFERGEAIGISCKHSIMLRLEDKISRIENLLVKERFVIEETLEDTILDAINYLGILKARMEFEKRMSELKLSPDVVRKNDMLKSGEEPSRRLTEPYLSIMGGAVSCVACGKMISENLRRYFVHGSYFHEECFGSYGPPLRLE